MHTVFFRNEILPTLFNAKSHQCYMHRIDVEEDSDTEEDEQSVVLDSCNGDRSDDWQKKMDRSTTSREAQGVAKNVVFKEKQSVILL
uniref:Uncharacterized protein n=1 Tax=Romanomermis culicivorax TaxID=13658 RepID=A0A915I8L4_ROMCU